MEYYHLDAGITQLDMALVGRNQDWKEIWYYIREINENFKNTNYPTKKERDEAWRYFQNLIKQAKELQEQDFKKRQEDRQEFIRMSFYNKEKILECARCAERPWIIEDIASNVFDATIGALPAMFGVSLDSERYKLQERSRFLKEGFSLLGEYKQEMTAEDKREAWDVLNRVSEELNEDWASYKKLSESAYYKRQQKHHEWLERHKAHIMNLEDRLAKLEDMLESAKSESYQDKVSGWISEAEDKLSSIRGKISNVQSWLAEAKDKL